MKIIVFGNVLDIADNLVNAYASRIHPFDMEEAEYLLATCGVKATDDGALMETELTLAMQDCLDIQSATPLVIKDMKENGYFN